MLGWYFDNTNVFIRQRQIHIHEIIVIKMEESLNFAVKTKL